MESEGQTSDVHPVGYGALVERYQLRAPRNWHRSRVSDANIHRIHSEGAYVDEVYPRVYAPEDSLGGHLEFALKYDGTNLGMLHLLFQKPVEAELLDYIRSRPTGRYARNGRLSARKREAFYFLSDRERERLEAAVRAGYDNDRAREALAAYGAGEED